MKTQRMMEFEFARIIACVIVICLHTSNWYIVGQHIVPSSLFIKCFLQDAVPVFWYIMGYFLFSTGNTRYSHLLKRTLFHVFFPAFCMMVIAQLFSPWLYGEQSFLYCLKNFQIDYYNLFGNLFQWKSSMTLGGHFWYIFSYIKVILWYPLISLVCNSDKKPTRCRYYILLLSLLAIVVTDFLKMSPLIMNGREFKVIPYSIIDNSLLHVLLGYETYVHRDFIYKNRKKFLIGGSICFVLFNIQRYFLQIALFRADLKNDYFLHIDSLNSFLSSYALFIALITIPIPKSAYINKVLWNISSKTFGIYVIHRCVYEKLNNMLVRDRIYAASSNKFLYEVMSTITYAIVVFGVSYCIILILQLLAKTWKQVCYIFSPVT